MEEVASNLQVVLMFKLQVDFYFYSAILYLFVKVITERVI